MFFTLTNVFNYFVYLSENAQFTFQENLLNIHLLSHGLFSQLINYANKYKDL